MCTSANYRNHKVFSLKPNLMACCKVCALLEQFTGDKSCIKGTRGTWLTYPISWYCVVWSLSLIALKTATLTTSFEFSLPILMPGMCQTHAIRERTVPNCSLIFSYLCSHWCIQRTSLFLTLKIQGASCAFFSGTWMGQKFTHKSILWLPSSSSWRECLILLGFWWHQITYFGCL